MKPYYIAVNVHGFPRLLRKLTRDIKEKSPIAGVPTRSKMFPETVLHLKIGTGRLVEKSFNGQKRPNAS